ncbi:hypothetical protein [Enterocloster lavalensis]|uniref:hypothetical protein n=1 Tax=Enterocloster lavalensis TaxID=460384 RepID=UPI0034A2569B
MKMEKLPKTIQLVLAGTILLADFKRFTKNKNAQNQQNPAFGVSSNVPERIRTAGLPLRSRPDTTSGSDI